MPNLSWVRVDASELVDAVDEHRIAEIIPSAPGLYLWRRNIRAPRTARASTQDCLSWLAATTEAPSASIGPRNITHCLSIDGLKLGGGGLPLAKQVTVQKIAEHRKPRERLLDIIDTLSSFTPILYVGQTTDLAVRAAQHVTFQTTLALYLQDVLRLTWQDLEFNYLVLSTRTDVSPEVRAFQELVELIAQRLLAPVATERPG